MKQFLIVLFFLSSYFTLLAQGNKVHAGCVGFYNLENLFDTEDDPDIRDEEYLPTGKRLYTDEVYHKKLTKLATVISKLGMDFTEDGVSVLGVSEIENRKVLADLVAHPKLMDRKYQIVHFQSKDERGIDVGLIYQPKYFEVLNARIDSVTLYDDKGERDYTRDALLVSGLYKGEVMHFIVNHWPSRSGGTNRSNSHRVKSAQVCKNIIDSLLNADPNAKIILMGDLNDDPNDESVKIILNSTGKKAESLKKGMLYNIMYDFFKKGHGSLAYHDAWNLFDQIIISPALLKDKKGFRFYKAKIYKDDFLFTQCGKYKGYPKRTYSGNVFNGGYSDHLPALMYLTKK